MRKQILCRHMKTLDNTIQKSIDLHQSLAYRVHRLARILRIHLSRFIAVHGEEMSAEQYIVFLRAHANEGCHQGELAEPNLDDYSNVTRLVDSLVKKDLLKRMPDSKDRRSHRIFLTLKGHDLANQLIPAVVTERSHLEGWLTDEETNQFYAMLEKIETIAFDRTRRI